MTVQNMFVSHLLVTNRTIKRPGILMSIKMLTKTFFMFQPVDIDIVKSNFGNFMFKLLPSTTNVALNFGRRCSRMFKPDVILECLFVFELMCTYLAHIFSLQFMNLTYVASQQHPRPKTDVNRSISLCKT